MGRILFWVGFAVIVWAVIVLGRRRREAADRAARREAKREAREAQAAMPVPMKTCPVCGTHFPGSEAVMGDGVAYCSEKCRGKARAAKFEDILHREK